MKPKPKKQTRTEPQPEPETQSQAAGAEEATFDWSQEQGAATGFEGTRPEELGIPYLSIMQKGSPEVDETHKDHAIKKIEGARAGQIINTLSREIVYDSKETGPIQMVPMFHQRIWPEWKTVGGFVQNHYTPVILTKTKRNEKNQDILPNGNEIITTSYFAVYILVDGVTQFDHPDEAKRPIRAILAMSSTQLKKSKIWMNMMQAIKINGRTPPMYSHIYNVSTIVESNEKGSWFGWNFEICRPLTIKDVQIINEAKQVAGTMSKDVKLLAAPTPEPTASGPSHETSESEQSAADSYAEQQGGRAKR